MKRFLFSVSVLWVFLGVSSVDAFVLLGGHCAPTEEVARASYRILQKSARNDDSGEILNATLPDLGNEQLEGSNIASFAFNQEFSERYRIAKVAFGLVASMIFLVPSKYGNKLLATKFGGAAGFAVAAGICSILEASSKKGEVVDDTGKRLNLGLAGFCLFGLAAMPGEAAFSGNPLYIAGLAIATTTSRLYGLATSLSSWRSMIDLKHTWTQELTAGVTSNLKGLRVKNKKKALTYRNLLLLVFFGMMSTFLEGVHKLENRKFFPKSAFEISLHWSGVSRLFLMSSLIYSLKEAGERGRLAETRPIRLNYLVCAWAFAVSIGQGFGFEFLFAGLIFLIKGYKGQREKDGTLLPIDDARSRRWKRYKPNDDEDDQE